MLAPDATSLRGIGRARRHAATFVLLAPRRAIFSASCGRDAV